MLVRAVVVAQAQGCSVGVAHCDGVRNGIGAATSIQDYGSQTPAFVTQHSKKHSRGVAECKGECESECEGIAASGAGVSIQAVHF